MLPIFFTFAHFASKSQTLQHSYKDTNKFSNLQNRSPQEPQTNDYSDSPSAKIGYSAKKNDRRAYFTDGYFSQFAFLTIFVTA
jgi:hypothetical protein